MSKKADRNFPVWSKNPNRDSAQSLLLKIGGPGFELSERQCQRLVADRKLECCSGRIETFLQEYHQKGWGRGEQRWQPSALSGYVTMAEASKSTGWSRPTLYNRINQGLLETVKDPQGRRWVSELSLNSIMSHGAHCVMSDPGSDAVIYEVV